MEVESFFPGRLRVRSHLFTQHEVMGRLKELADAIQGISHISGNLDTGSVTVLYDPNIISMPMLMEAKSKIDELVQEFTHHTDERMTSSYNRKE